MVPTVDGALAFVPAPIPRDLPLDGMTIGLLSAADHALGRLDGITDRLVNPYLVGSPLLHREAILSSKIEGTVTTPEQLVLLEVAEDPRRGSQAPDPDTVEVLNYIHAMNHGLERLEDLPVCLRLIREIHAELLTGVRGDRERPGEFRTSQNWIGRRGSPIHQARFVPPPVIEMREALDDFETYLNDGPQTLPPLIQLALVHYQFETIHPFRDGNGRIGRLLIPLLLCTRGRMRRPLLYLSSYFERNREAYMDLLLHVSETGAWVDWIRFFLQGVAECANEAAGQAKGLLELRQQYHARFQSARHSALLQKLIDDLFRSPSVTIKNAAKLLEVTEAAASYNIRKLCEVGILVEVSGRKRSQKFLAPEIVAFMRDRHPATEKPTDIETQNRE